MPYLRYKVLVEYDGWQHERDGRQRQRDRVRLEELAAAGWTVIVVTSRDLAFPADVASRVRRALIARGWRRANAL
jgi:very-short-patch-repair endonuclease